MDLAYNALDRGYIPDFALRRAIRALNAQRIASLIKPSPSYGAHIAAKLEYVRSLKNREIAIKTAQANEQHYEVDTEFMLSALGKNAKYSCCLYETGKETLDEAEEAMLNSYAAKAKLRDGQAMLDLGCGWGSLSLWLAARYPSSQITALSNSRTQKLHIDATAKQRGLTNLTVVTGDVKEHQFKEESFDRILSIEMFEHMKNYALLFEKVATWLKRTPKDASADDKALLFIHIFCHRTTPYHFEEGDGWMTKHFFEGGTMPSHDLFLHFQKDVVLEEMWWLNGKHYARTCEDWLAKQDAGNKGGKSIAALRKDAERKGNDPLEGEKTFYRFRVFYLACAEFFGTNDGEEWGVGHYLFSRRD
ncbi:S-adenosyl-L-methionine-dependent methyltransferase [Tilletiopsis washingtonensis]|uniref:S-adenosyl-L-methionine-dependent methyltransferase n=1 Tax=Tilletiopsis washingtonensis TaxID=58919 RepID=A0A316Z3U0_9BASI|nr:S-adenosyl-L-methionine-dependent methyltransferase [Tilletiopsis washingtonensis]PWN95744.1 S-adenosyl-L-methionine-dependent methyltransferase [Tilletiopsis washingtonensis]